jgi:hypothetical protein
MKKAINKIGHFFFPGYSNNQRAKIIHSSSIIALSLALVVYQLIIQSISYTDLRILGYAANIPISRVVDLTNQKRVENGLAPLNYSDQLSNAALFKGNDMLAKNYWAHIAPDGTEPWKFFLDAGYRYKYAGENLARDFSNAESAIEAWMTSPTHKENLLSPRYTEIGVAVVEGDLGGVEATIIVQLFGTRQVSDSSIAVASAETQVPAETTPAPRQIEPVPQAVVEIPPESANGVEPGPEPTEFDTSSNPQAGVSAQNRVLISPFTITKDVSAVVIIVLLVVLMIDGYITHKRNISRLSGRTWAHILYLTMIFIVALMASSGRVL